MHHRRKFFLFALWPTLWFSLLQPSTEAQKKNPMAPLQFLVGAWSGIGYGKPGEAIKGLTTFSWELDGNIIVRKNRAEYAPASGGVVKTIHEDLMIIYQQPGGEKICATYFDNEGHVINYTASFPARQPAVVFESTASEKSPRFRLVYEIGSDEVLTNEFYIAPPGGGFRLYVKGTIKREK
jgi:hypothetical protein